MSAVLFIVKDYEAFADRYPVFVNVRFIQELAGGLKVIRTDVCADRSIFKPMRTDDNVTSWQFIDGTLGHV